MSELETRYASRAGAKLHHAFQVFDICPHDWDVADFGCSTGGFVDCWLKHGARAVYALDTGYGQLDYTLRIDPRVHVMERTNAMHAPPPPPLAHRTDAPGIVDCISVDLSWTTHEKSLPNVHRWLNAHNDDRTKEAPKSPQCVLLLKPHYEATGGPFRSDYAALVADGVLPKEHTSAVLNATFENIEKLGFRIRNQTPSPIAGAKSKRSRAKSGENIEHLVHLELVSESGDAAGGRTP